MLNARAIAFYLPQFHPIPENDLWWGKGFTEWTNTAKARPMFHGHYQPHIPADLGFYDLRVAETRVQQAEMAATYGIEGFCYYHYWFAGRRILERPFNEMVTSSSPDFPFCVCWANETWSGIWHGTPNKVLIEQTYPGEADHRAHFATLLPAFRDPRYIRVDGKPMFIIYQPLQMPDVSGTLRFWRAMAADAGLAGLHVVANSLSQDENPLQFGYDAIVHNHTPKHHQWRDDWRSPLVRVRQKVGHWRGAPHVHEYADLAASQMTARGGDNVYRCVIHAWDNTPRSGRNGVAYRNPDPELFRNVLDANVEAMSNRPLEHRLVFLKSWNEWAEGNHLEPDLQYGTAYLKVVADVLRKGVVPSA